MKTSNEVIELVKKFKDNDESAFTGLYEETYKYLHTCAIHVVKDEDTAQDILQDVYLEIYKHIDQLNKESDFLSWAATITNRKCFRYIQKQSELLVNNTVDEEGNESDYFEDISDDESIIPENILDDMEKVNIIKGIIDDLSDIQRACVIGFYYNEQKQDEIAEELGVPVNTVKSHLNRAKAKIKESVGDVEKKQGIRLHSFAPFMLMFFLKDAEVYATGASIPELTIKMGTASGTAVTGGKLVSTKITAGAKATAIALKTKIISGIVVGAVAVGGITGIALHNKNKIPDHADVYIDQGQLMDEVSVYGMTMSTLKQQDIIDYMEQLKSEYESLADHIDESIEYKGAWRSIIDYDGPTSGRDVGRCTTYYLKDSDKRFLYKEYAEGQFNDSYTTYCRFYEVRGDSADYETCNLIKTIDNTEYTTVYGKSNLLHWRYYYDLEKTEVIIEKLRDHGIFPMEDYVVNNYRGKTVEQVLDGIYKDLYTMALANEFVTFNNGTLRIHYDDNRAIKSVSIVYDDYENKGYLFHVTWFLVDDSGTVVGMQFSSS